MIQFQRSIIITIITFFWLIIFVLWWSTNFYNINNNEIFDRFISQTINNKVSGLESIIENRNIPGKKLHGRFLHITDIHPDELYQEGNSISFVCHYPSTHHHLSEDEELIYEDRAPKFGKPMAGCDSPVALMDATLNWINENLKDSIDFIIWTGDNMRHDNDRTHPRFESKIFDMNKILTDKFYYEICKNNDSHNPRELDLDLIPSIGNNDVFPHNVFALGPTLQTREFYRIWHWFIPEEQQKTFDRSGSFIREVIPNKLAVISINTLYLFKANPLVDNCMKPSESGYQLLLWLGHVLEEVRARGMKVWLSGHVPPLLKNYESSCYHKFTLWTHEYRDVIIGGVYGHMNMDHFVPVDGKESRKYLKKITGTNNNDFFLKADDDDDDDEDDIPFLIQGSKPQNKGSYMERVRIDSYQKIAKKLSPERRKRKGKKPKNAKDLQSRYSIVNVAGSVIPTFNPSMRVWEYNISDLDLDLSSNGEYNINQGRESWDTFFTNLNQIMDDSINFSQRDNKENVVNIFDIDKSIPNKMPNDLPLGPAYEPQMFTPTKFIQYFADLDKINDDYYRYIKMGLSEEDATSKAFKYQVEYTSDDKPFNGRPLLVSDYLEIAAELGKDKTEWRDYLHKVFGATDYTDD